MGVVGILGRMLAGWDDCGVLLAVLGALDKLLTTDKKLGRDWKLELEAADGVDRLEQLQNHTNDLVYKEAAKLITDHFCDDEEETEDENILPGNNGDDNMFGFGLPSKQLFSSPGSSPQTPITFKFGTSSTNLDGVTPHPV